jgi:amino acid transporter
MIGTGVYHLWRDAAERPVRIGRARWFGLMAGAAVIVFAFALDYRNIMAGGMPHSFNWWIFGLGLGGGLVNYATAAMKAC